MPAKKKKNPAPNANHSSSTGNSSTSSSASSSANSSASSTRRMNEEKPEIKQAPPNFLSGILGGSANPMANFKAYNPFGSFNPFGGAESKQEENPFQAMLPMLQKINRMDTNQFFQQFLTQPRFSSLVPEILALLLPLLMKGMNVGFERKFKDTNSLLRALYTMRSKGYDKSFLSMDDPVLQNALLNRIIYTINLELIYEHNSSLYVDFLQKEILNNLGDSIPIKTRIEKIRLLINSPSGFEGLFNFGVLNHIDYLSGNKFKALFIHPSILWDGQNFAAFKHPINISKLRKDILSSTIVTEGPRLEAFVARFVTLHQEMIGIYDLLAENDRELLAYCKEKEYSEETLFSYNKTCILEALDGSLNYFKELDLPTEGRVISRINANKTLASQQEGWEKIVEETGLSQLMSPVQVSYITYLFHPDFFFEIVLGCMENFDVELADNLAKKIISSENLQHLLPHLDKMIPASYLPFVPLLMPVLNQMLGSLRENIHAFLQALSVAQKGGRNALVLLLEQITSSELFNTSKASSFKAVEALGIAQFLPADYPVPSFQLILDSIQAEKSQLKNLQEKAQDKTKQPKASPALTDDFITQLEKSGFNKTLVRPALQRDPALFLLKAIEKRAYTFVHEYVTLFDKQSNKDRIFDLVPSTQKEQRQLLLTALAYFHSDEKRAKPTLKILLCSGKYHWCLDIIQEIEKKEPEGFAKNLLKAYLETSKKAKELADNLALEQEETPAEESRAESKEAVCLHLPLQTQSRSAFFASLNHEMINARELARQLEEYAKPLPPSMQHMQNAQSYALTMLSLRFFQAYHRASRPQMKYLSLEVARHIRNALVHPQINDSLQNSGFGFVLDAKEAELVDFSQFLAQAISSRDGLILKGHPLFVILENHGDSLAENQQAGQNEYVKFRQRILYSRFLDGLFKSFQALKTTEQDPENKEILEMALMMLRIRGLVYCLREAACRPSILEEEIAMRVRHSSAKLDMPEVQTGMTAGAGV